MPTSTEFITPASRNRLGFSKGVLTRLILSLCLFAVWFWMYQRPRSICQSAWGELMSQPHLTMGYANGEQTPLTKEELTQCRTISQSLRIVQSTHAGQVALACGNTCIHVESETLNSIDAFVTMDSLAVRINGELYSCRYKLTQAIPTVGAGAFGQLLNRLHQIPDPNW